MSVQFTQCLYHKCLLTICTVLCWRD